MPALVVLAALFAHVDVMTRAHYRQLKRRVRRLRASRTFGVGWLDAFRLSGVAPISGGSGGVLTEEDKAGIVTVIQGAMKPTVDGLAAIQAEVTALRAENDNLKRAVRVEREGDRELFLLNGQKFDFGAGVAPSRVRSGSLGDRPILMTDYARLVQAQHGQGDVNKFSRLQDITEKMLNLGHKREGGNKLLPLTMNPDYFDNGTEAGDAFCRDIKAAAWSDPDPETTQDQLRWLVAKLATKQQASDNDLLGGSLAGLPITGDIIPLLQATAALGRAGARAVPLPPTGMRWPRETGEPTFAYYNENGTITASTVSTGVLNMSPKKAAGVIKIPNELLLMVNAAESFFRSSLVRKAALTEDLAGLEGEGGSTKPKGIIKYDRSANDTPTAGKVTLHNAATTAANGDTIGAADPRTVIALVEAANDGEGPSAFIMRPMEWSYLVNRRADAVTAADGAGPFLFLDVARTAENVTKVLAGLPVIVSTQVNKTSIKGSGTTLTYVLCGNFRRVLLGRVGSIELATDTSLGFLEEQIFVRAIYRHDVALEQESSMVLVPTLLNG